MQTAEFVRSYFDAWNHHDPKGVAEHLASDGIYLDIPEKVSRTHDELVQFLSDFFAEHAHRYELVGEIVSGPNTIAFQYQILGVGEPSERAYSGAEFMMLNGDAAIAITDYYDTRGFGRPSSAGTAGSSQRERLKYAKSGLSEAQMLAYKQQLEETMHREQAFLRPDLTLPRLAKAVGCSVNHLSQVINSGFGMSFFDYVNQYRVQYAKLLLGKNDQQSNIILNIAFAAGFNSNSAFYTAFKKCVGQTPAQYRNQQLSEVH